MYSPSVTTDVPSVSAFKSSETADLSLADNGEEASVKGTILLHNVSPKY